MVMLQQSAVHRVHHALAFNAAHYIQRQTLHAAECMLQTPAPGSKNGARVDTEECNIATLMQHTLFGAYACAVVL